MTNEILQKRFWSWFKKIKLLWLTQKINQTKSWFSSRQVRHSKNSCLPPQIVWPNKTCSNHEKIIFMKKQLFKCVFKLFTKSKKNYYQTTKNFWWCQFLQRNFSKIKYFLNYIVFNIKKLISSKIKVVKKINTKNRDFWWFFFVSKLWIFRKQED